MNPVASDRLWVMQWSASGDNVKRLHALIEDWLHADGAPVQVVKTDMAMCVTAAGMVHVTVLIWYEAPPLQSQQDPEPLSFT